LLVILAACQGAPGTPPAAMKPLREFRGIIHCHTLYSHDSKGTYEEILAAAKAAKIDFICVTDHPPKDDKGRSLREGWKGIHDGVLFIQGAEYSDQILGLGLKEPISGKDRRETIKAIHEQGGVAIACHPELIDDWDAFAEADGMEIYNVHATLQRKAKDKIWMLRIPKVMKENPEGSFQELQELDPAILRKFDEINQKRPFAGIAGNDAHQNVSFFGYQLDPYPRAFRFVTTHVFAEELTEKAVLDAIRNARCRVIFEISGDPGQANSVKRVEKAYLNGEYVGTGDDLEKRIVPNQVFVSRLEYYREDGKPWILEAPRRPGRP
jgi:predicted metal-dependent phosphoesterase TrpH